MNTLKTPVRVKAVQERNDSAFCPVTFQRKQKDMEARCPVNTLLTQIFSGIAWNG